MTKCGGLLVSLWFFASTAVLAEPKQQQAYCSCECKDGYGKVTSVLVSPGGNVSAAACKALNGATCGTEDISTVGTLKCGGGITVQRSALGNILGAHPPPVRDSNQ
jgi:hypothetical protein